MPGCFGYATLDVGIFSGSLTAGGQSTFALAIPNHSALAGQVLASQGLALTPTTPLGLIASNGVSLTLGN